MSETNWRTPHEYKISGVPVSFPCKAYPSQMAMMSKIILSLQKGRNCLLESPTGSGKSLALLCASLAWQKHEIARVNEYNEAVRNGIIEPEEEQIPPDEMQDEYPGEDTGAGFFASKEKDEEDDDFQSPKTKKNEPIRSLKDLEQFKVENQASKPAMNAPQGTRKVFKKRVPKIYFGTRTHKQISQIVRELRKTAYSGVKMSILGSRDHTCIEPTVMQSKNRNEGCRELREGHGCTFMGNVKSKLSDHYAFNTYRGKSEAWDLEDIVKVGKKVRACPYYSIRELKNKSNIIFCPYNYLVEPMIRKSMEISLKNNIVILDEAHNIEDSARSAASWHVGQAVIRESMQDLEKMAAFYRDTHLGDPEPYLKLASLGSKVSTWIDEAKNEGSNDSTCQSFSDFGSTSKVWTGTNIVAKFIIHGFGPEAYFENLKAFEQVTADIKLKTEEESNEAKHEQQHKTPVLHANTTSMLEGFLTVLGHIYNQDQKFRDDFRVALVRTQENRTNNSGGWFGGKKTTTTLDFAYSAHFWCLNPAVIFDELKDSVRSIVLTSGTLSPMASFSSELNVEFPIQLEANHVIDKKQVWIGTLSHGPSGHELRATYEFTESFQFQDEIGKLTLAICNTIAHGVLLFLPSYKLLNKLCERWQTTGLWQDITKKKVIVTEPRFSDEFESSIRHFYEVIESTAKSSNSGNVDGALFIAVCRGKVSEGLDFADNNARAVICLGIPFPNIKDAQVKLKMTYNDKKNQGNKSILTGREWYEIQAFRALNQALGRCIRHRKDWGAILMVDQRYGQIRRYVDSLSKWVRNGVQHHNSCIDVMDQLSLFSQEMSLLDQDSKEESVKKPSEVIEEAPKIMPIFEKKKKASIVKKTPMNEWLNGNKNSPQMTKETPRLNFEAIKTIENDANAGNNQPAPKKFKFNPVSPPLNNDQADDKKPPKEELITKSVEKRKGFVQPRKNAIFYGDAGDSDDDFQ